MERFHLDDTERGRQYLAYLIVENDKKAEFLIRYQRKMIDRGMIYRSDEYLSIPISRAGNNECAPVMRLNANFFPLG